LKKVKVQYNPNPIPCGIVEKVGIALSNKANNMYMSVIAFPEIETTDLKSIGLCKCYTTTDESDIWFGNVELLYICPCGWWPTSISMHSCLAYMYHRKGVNTSEYKRKLHFSMLVKIPKINKSGKIKEKAKKKEDLPKSLFVSLQKLWNESFLLGLPIVTVWT
jgi:hypothetical protein